MKVIIVFVLSIATLGINAFENKNNDPLPVSVMKLARTTPHSSFFTGTVEYGKSITMAFSNKGYINFVATAGTSVNNWLMDPRKVVEPGDIIAQQDTYIPENNIKTASIKLQEAEIILGEQQKAFEREKSLFEKKVISEKQFIHTQQTYNSALLEYSNAKLELEQAQYIYKSCFIRAPFRGVVEEVYYSPGTVVDKAIPVVKVSILSLAKIVIKLPEDITRKIDAKTEVKVYPSGAAVPTFAWFEDRDVKTFALECYATNAQYPVDEMPEEYRNMTIISDLSYVSSLSRFEKEAPLWIAPRALKKDAEGSFVWRIKDARAMEADKHVKQVVVLEKVHVEMNDSKINHGVYQLAALKNAGKLNRYDILAAHVPENVKDGDSVIYQKSRLLFRPGEQVSVHISPNPTVTGFYVPVQALHKNKENDNIYIIAYNHGLAKFITVTPEEEYNNKICIKSAELKDGMLIVTSSVDKINEQGTLLKAIRTYEPITFENNGEETKTENTVSPPTAAKNNFIKHSTDDE